MQERKVKKQAAAEFNYYHHEPGYGGESAPRFSGSRQGDLDRRNPVFVLKVAASGDLSGGGGGGDDEGAMRDWEEGGRFSFEDSDRFEEDSLCSWSSEPESLCNNWRGWKKPTISSGSFNFATGRRTYDGKYI